MNKFIKKIIGATLGLAMAVGVGVAIGSQKEALQADAANASLTFTSASAVSSGGITATPAKATGSNAPGWYSSSLRLYANNTLTITSTVGNMTAISMTWTKNGNKAFADVSTDVGSYTHASESGKTGSWTGDASSVVFTVGASGQIQTTTISITYSAAAAKTLSSIEVTDNSGKVWHAGDTLNASDLKVVATYSSGNPATITDGTGVYFNAGHTQTTLDLAEGDNDITVYYTDAYGSASDELTINAAAAITLSSIAITTPPTKTAYFEGDSFRSAGMVVTATYSDESTDDVTEDCEFSPSGALSMSDDEITVSYTYKGVEKTATQAIVVNAAPSHYDIDFGSTKNTNPTEIKSNADFKDTYSVSSDVTAGDFAKIYGISTSQLKCGSGSATAAISFTIPSSSYIVSVSVTVETAGGTSLNVTSGAVSAETENQAIEVGTLTFNSYLPNEYSNKVTLSSTVSGAFYLSSIKIYYVEFEPELHASSASVEAAVNTSNQSINLTYNHFTPTSYSAEVLSGTSLTAGAVAFNLSSTPHTATFTTGASTGVTVFRITGTQGNKEAYVDVTVTVTGVRNLQSLTITTPSNKTAFRVGQTFDVGSLAITATFDAEPTTVVYSAANNNLGALTFAPEIGYEFDEGDIGTVTSVIAELEVGTGDEMIEYAIAVSDKIYAPKISSVSDLWDGQRIYFGDTDGTRVNVAHSGGNQLGSEEATVHETKGLSLDDVTNAAPYTVRREKIGNDVYYSFSNGGYYLKDTGSGDNNYLGKSAELDDNCRFSITIENGEVSMTNKGNTSKPLFRWNTGSNWFSCYGDKSTSPKPTMYIVAAYSVAGVADSFEENRLHMSDYTSNEGWCKDNEHAYYANAKAVWNAMSSDERTAVSANAKARLAAWAAANGDTYDGGNGAIAAANALLPFTSGNETDVLPIIIVLALSSVAVTGAFFFLRKRKQQEL